MVDPRLEAEFRLAKATCCELHKQDIPEVQAVIRLLDRPLSFELRRLGNEILDRISGRLAELPDELGRSEVDPVAESDHPEDTLAAILAALLLVIDARVTAPLSPRVESLVEAAIDSLMGDAAASVGRAYEGAGRAVVRRAAIAELETLYRDTVRSRRAEIESALRTILTNRQARQDLSVLAQAGLGPRPAGSAPRSLQEALADVRRAVTGEADTAGRPPAGPGSRTGATLDSWAYRWWAVTQLETLAEAGVQIVRIVNNPPLGPDTRTTAFCRWVHGRLKRVVELRAQVRRHVTAALEGDADALRGNWGFIDPQVARSGSEDQFAAYFRTAGLPPYHFGCRDDVEEFRPDGT